MNQTMSLRTKANSFLGWLAGLLLSLRGKSTLKTGPEDFKKADFKTSTQHLGVRFTERIRDVFRFRWLKKH
jgi:hypothetical protein